MYTLSIAHDIEDYRSEAHLSDGIDFSVETAEEAAEMVSYFIKKGFEVSVTNVRRLLNGRPQNVFKIYY